jgi:hypothetical protein
MPPKPLNKKYCPRGHEYTKANTYLQKPGLLSGGKSLGKVCRQCRKEKDQIRRGVPERPVDWKPKTGQYVHKSKYASSKEKCRHNWTKLKERQREFMNSLKTKGCSMCGYNKCYGALEFHHIDGSNKEGNINSMARDRDKTKAMAEVKKCILVCANCHREIHYGLKEAEAKKCG